MRGRRLGLALGALLLLATGGAVLVPLLRAATSGEPAVSSTAQLMACAQAPGDGYCERLAGDRAARGPLSSIDRDTGERYVERIREAFEAHLGAVCRAEFDACQFAEPPTVESLRAALVAAGLPGPVVRPVRYTDPAPLGATIYAVRAGAGCAVGWVEGGAGRAPQVVGRHRDGRCLPA
ncbi:hypothetical protein RB614_12255 [Phytohabitans sp. ZYX-F-186]|uniref:DUF732 domain-containing protein n=1 Tax=Phytohabitans maris TaxID=3071409 RepID=A0ABU0ZE07_9ACTN|nr:hypothetical protein [Phytohabitans sp. ZYX-F-186]MDQ7905296.1 hypothetical protein [Phytohabitans sp. ZYX-F-186]